MRKKHVPRWLLWQKRVAHDAFFTLKRKRKFNCIDIVVPSLGGSIGATETKRLATDAENFAAFIATKRKKRVMYDTLLP